MALYEEGRAAVARQLGELAPTLNVKLDARQLHLFGLYYQILLDWNRRVNLTRITEAREVVVKHFLDSLTCLQLLPRNTLKLIDVGTGAGFPGVPLKIIRPALRVTLLDSVGKKIAFLDHLVSALELEGVTTIHGRAEDLGQATEHRGAYDAAVSRAVAALPTLAEYCLPFLRPGGRMIAMKTMAAEPELTAAKGAISVLGGRLLEARAVNLPDLDLPRLLVVIEKTTATPGAFPRSGGLPAKKPIGS